MKVRRELTPHQKLFGAMLRMQTSFLRHFWQSDMTLPPSTRQKTFFNDESDRVLLCTGRKTAKTLNLEAQQIRNSINHRTHGGAIEECMMVTPGEAQLSPIWDRVINRIDNQPLFNLLCKNKPKNDGKIEWQTGVVWYYRIDGDTGTDKNMIGLRCKRIIGDEMAYTVRVCHNSRKQSALPDCKWLYCGVPNGVRHTPFWELDQSKAGADWSRHKFSTYVNPLYWDEKRKTVLIADYGGGSSQDYITQVMGGWGEELFSSFPPGSMKVVPTLPYAVARLSSNDIPADYSPLDAALLLSRLKIPRVPGIQQICIGMDYGHLQDPTEITLAYRTDLQAHDWNLMARIELVGANHLTQARFLRMLADGLDPRLIVAACLDQASEGRAVATTLMEGENGVWWAGILSDFAANGTVEVDVAGRGREKLDDDPAVDPSGRVKAIPKKKVRRKQYFTQALQLALLSAKNDLPGDARLYLPNDAEMLQELIDTRERKMESGYVVYVPRMDSHNRPVDHITDSLRALIAAILSARDDGAELDEEDGTVYEETPLFGFKPSFGLSPLNPLRQGQAAFRRR